jgi:hypothetical protein
MTQQLRIGALKTIGVKLVFARICNSDTFLLCAARNMMLCHVACGVVISLFAFCCPSHKEKHEIVAYRRYSTRKRIEYFENFECLHRRAEGKAS